MDDSDAQHARGKLVSRPTEQSRGRAVVREAGERPLALGSGTRDGLLYVPASYDPTRRAPLFVALHGAGGNASHALAPFRAEAERCGVIVLAPDSRARSSWDVIESGELGPDVTFLDAALAQVFAHFAVDPQRTAIGGFSDGASYALTLGVGNGELFHQVLAFSPGFLATVERSGRPGIFIAHGTRDQVLPIEHCSRRLAPALERAGYAVRYVEFDGAHTVRSEDVRGAFDQYLCSPATDTQPGG